MMSPRPWRIRVCLRTERCAFAETTRRTRGSFTWSADLPPNGQSKYVGVKEKFLDADRLEQKYAVRLPSDIREGVRRTVQWYSDHFDEVKERRKFAPPACIKKS